MTPSNANSSRSRPDTIRRDKVAGWCSSSAGIRICAVMIAVTPASMAAFERQELDATKPFDRMLDERKFEM